MSEALDRGSVVQLTAAVERLTLAVDRLSSQLSGLPASSASPAVVASAPCSSWSPVESDWELVEEESLALDPESSNHVSRLLLGHGLESGPPGLPRACKELALQRLQGSRDLCLKRAEVAFASGFWARIAIDTHTDSYSGKTQDFGIRPKHWVVLRGGKLGPVRFSDASSYAKGVEIWDTGVIAESFGSLVEVRIFCAGASRPVPQLKRWRK